LQTRLDKISPEILNFALMQTFPTIALDGGVAQWTSHPPQEREDPGSNPARE
jgi:hypothetical protein